MARFINKAISGQSMKVSTTARLFASQALWGLTGIDAIGRVLVDALAEEDEDVRTIAGILLTKSGRKAEPLLGEALKQGKHVPMVISVLGSIGDRNALPTIRPFTRSDDPQVARAAREAITVIEAESSA